jgi:electron transport complex protein RnfD
MSLQAVKNAFVVSSAPHIHSGARVSKVMYTFAVALLPAIFHSISVFGMHSVRVISISVASAIISEAVIQRLFKRPVTIHDGSAFLSGLLFAMIMPPSA